MAIGDQALAAGYTIVPDTGEEGRVRHGARELNRTRDYIAGVKATIPTSPLEYRVAAGITAGIAFPDDADGKPNGTVYFKIL